jgi:hypothetical protein
MHIQADFRYHLQALGDRTNCIKPACCVRSFAISSQIVAFWGANAGIVLSVAVGRLDVSAAVFYSPAAKRPVLAKLGRHTRRKEGKQNRPTVDFWQRPMAADGQTPVPSQLASTGVKG